MEIGLDIVFLGALYSMIETFSESYYFSFLFLFSFVFHLGPENQEAAVC